MKIIVLHGDYTKKSYEMFHRLLNKARTQGLEIIRIDENSNLSLPEQLVSQSLFEKEKLFVIENPLKISLSDFNWLKGKHKDINKTLIIYYSGYLHKKILNSFPKIVKIYEFKLPRLIWKFLESLYPGNSKSCLKLLNNVLINEPKEFVFFLLAKQLRDLYWVSIDEKSLNYPAWRISKLKRQSMMYKDSQLKSLIKNLAEIDVKSKTSKADLKDSLDFLIATHLE